MLAFTCSPEVQPSCLHTSTWGQEMCQSIHG